MAETQKRQGEARRNFSMQLPVADYEGLARTAKQRDVPKAVVVRELVQEFLKREEQKNHGMT